jgi:hypothetical protein
MPWIRPETFLFTHFPPLPPISCLLRYQHSTLTSRCSNYTRTEGVGVVLLTHLSQFNAGKTSRSTSSQHSQLIGVQLVHFPRYMKAHHLKLFHDAFDWFPSHLRHPKLSGRVADAGCSGRCGASVFVSLSATDDNLSTILCLMRRRRFPTGLSYRLLARSREDIDWPTGVQTPPPEPLG